MCKIRRRVLWLGSLGGLGVSNILSRCGFRGQRPLLSPSPPPGNLRTGLKNATARSRPRARRSQKFLAPLSPVVLQQNVSDNVRAAGLKSRGGDGDPVDQPCGEDTGEDDDRADNSVERAGDGGGGESARARPSRLEGAGGVKVVTTPAQRGSGGRAARKPPLSSRSERKPPR